MAVQALEVGINQDWEIGIGGSRLDQFVLVVVGAEHQIQSGFIQERNEMLADHVVAVPSVLTRRHVAESDFYCRILVLVAFYNLFQPFGFLFYIGICNHDIQVPDITHHLVLARIQEQEEILAVRDRIIGLSCRSLVIVEILYRIVAPILMVSAD